MLMEQHPLGRGTILFRQMFSAESLTSPHPGFPELFQTGETYHGQPLVDHQHPHNVFAELSLYYTRPISDKISWLFYGGPVAEPALGPVAYMHRASADELPMAPLSHHLQDSTHTAFGVVTTGLIVDRFKIEDSVFNGREPGTPLWDPVRCARLMVSAFQRRALIALDRAVQLWTAGASGSFGAGQRAPAIGFDRICAPVRRRVMGDFSDLGKEA
jgi:hypothetical protein